MNTVMIRKVPLALAVSFGIAFFPAGAALAQSPSESHIAAARAAIDSINATDPFDTILIDIATGLKVRLVANNPDLEDPISQFVDEEAIKLAARRGDLELEAAMIYARAFREEDLQAIAEFYRSDAGKALLENGPIATREVAQAAGIWRRGLERDLQEALNARLRDANLRATTVDGDAATGAGGAAEEGTSN